MKRSGLIIKTMPTEPKIRMRKCAAKSCRTPFKPWNSMVRCCSPLCAMEFVADERARKERKDRQEGLAKLKRRADHMADAQKAFNAFIRERDRDRPCICCGRTEHKVQGLRSHGWDCGHYRSVGSAPHMRFVEANSHRQLVYCNRDRSGNATDYRIGLIARIGLPAVEALEADQTPRKWTVDELLVIKSKYRALLKELKASASV